MFSISSVIYQVFSIVLFLLVILTIINVNRYINRRIKTDSETKIKLDDIIKLLDNK